MQANNNPVSDSPGVADERDDSAGESGTGGRDSGAIVYLDRREFLIASASDGRPKWHVNNADGTDECWVIASTFHRARIEASKLLLGCRKLKRDDMQRLMAEELKGE